MNFRYKLTTRTAPQAPEVPNVFIIDSDPAVREKLAVLARTAGWQPHTSASAEEFLARPRLIGEGCVIVELDLPGMSGLELQKLIADRQELPMVFMSSRADISAAVQAMKGGAFEFLTKPVIRDVFLRTLGQAVDCSRTALRQLQQSEALQHRFETLSRREREVMSLVVTGRLNKQVGGELGISEITVKAHRGKMMRKMQAASLAELVTMAANLHAEVRTA